MTALAAPATPAAGGDPDALFAELDAYLTQRMAELKVPGVAVGVIAGDREHTAGFGVTNLDHPLPVDADTLFQIGSTTKTFTATAIMRLVEQDKLDLEAAVRTYLPDFRVAAQHRIDLASPGLVGQVGGELIKRRRLAEAGGARLISRCGAHATCFRGRLDIFGRACHKRQSGGTCPGGETPEQVPRERA